MIKKLSRHGKNWALIIDRSIWELLGIDEHTALEVTTDGQALVVAPARSKKQRKRFEGALADTNERYGKALKRIAE